MINIYRKFIFSILISIAVSISAQISHASDNDEDNDIGLGGTGLVANGGLGGTGIIGEITGYGSIFVNGVEIEYDDTTPFTINGKSVKHQPLAIGDIVEVLTTDSNTYTHAKEINLRHELVGKVESIEPETYSFTVNGQTVVQAINKYAPPAIGKTVAVSGFRVDELTIMSTRVTVTDTQDKLLRTSTELPFQGKTDRWLLQSHVRDGKTSVQSGGESFGLSIQNAASKLKSRSQIRIMEIQKSAPGKIELNRVLEVDDLPRGRLNGTDQVPGAIAPSRQSPGTIPGGSTPRPGPGATPGSTTKGIIHNNMNSKIYRRN